MSVDRPMTLGIILSLERNVPRPRGKLLRSSLHKTITLIKLLTKHTLLSTIQQVKGT